jgi:hypothetical protein
LRTSELISLAASAILTRTRTELVSATERTWRMTAILGNPSRPSPRSTIAAPRVFAPRTMATLWIASALLCLASVAAFFTPTQISFIGSGIATGVHGPPGAPGAELLVFLAPRAAACVHVGDLVSVGGEAPCFARVEIVSAQRETAFELERRFALPAGSVSRIAEAACVVQARIDGAGPRLVGGARVPVEVFGERRTAQSFMVWSRDAEPASTFAR